MGLLLAGVAMAAGAGQAQTTATAQAVDFGSVSIGMAAKTAAITFTFNAPATVGAIQAVTRGNAGLDYTLAAGDAGACHTGAYAAGASCTVSVNFVPVTAGVRLGAAVLFAADGSPLAVERVRGTGVGPVAVINPGSVTSLTTALNNALAVAVDAMGNRFVADTGNGRVVEIDATGAQTVIAARLSNPVAIAVDAAGNVLVADAALGEVLQYARGATGVSATGTVIAQNLNGVAGLAVEPGGNIAVSLAATRQIVELSYGSAQPRVLATMAAGFTPGALAADGNGNLYVSATDAGSVAEIAADGTVTMLLSALKGPAGLAVDAAGDLYIAESYGSDVAEQTAGGQRVVLAQGVTASGVALEPDGSLAVSIGNGGSLLEIRRSDAQVYVGSLSDRLRLESSVENIGNAPLALSSVQVSTLTAGAAGAFTQAVTGQQDCAAGQILAAGQSCALEVQAAPAATTATVATKVSGQAQVVSNTLNAKGVGTLLHVEGGGADTLVFTTAPTATVTAGMNPGTVVISAESLGAVDASSSALVTLTVTQPSGSISAYTATAVNGVATFNLAGLTYTLTGTVLFTASDATDVSGTATVQVLPLAASKFVVSGYPTSVLTGTAHSVRVAIEDVYGNVVTGYPGTLTISSSDLAAVITPANYTFTTADAGVHVFTVKMNTVGTQTIYASNNIATGSQAGIKVVAAGSALTLSVNTVGTTTPVTAVAWGAAVTLRAVMSAASYPGTVKFVDSSLPADANTVGTAQLTSSGVATLSLTPAPGTHSYKATYVGTKTQAASVSAAAPLSVTGHLKTSTALVATGTATDYTLTATLTGYGLLTPTGAMNFEDTSNNYAVVGSVNLNTASFTTGLVAQTTLATGAYPQVVATGDFNGDGIQDAIVLNNNGNSLTVLLGNGDGTFNNLQTFTAGCCDVVAVQLNNNAPLGLAVADYFLSRILTYQGNGDGTFTLLQTIPLSSNPLHIAVGDVNNDGNMDLVATLPNVNGVAVLLGDGAGNLTLSNTVATSNDPGHVVLADFNNDGNLDMAATTNTGVNVWLGAGDGSFKAVSGSPFAAGSSGPLAAADLNGDGNVDLAVAASGVEYLLGDGKGGFSVGGTMAAGANPVAIIATDFNNNGYTDLLYLNYGSSTVNAIWNFGTYTLAGVPIATVGNYPEALAAVDLNGDGLPDLLVANMNDSTLSVYLSEQTATVSVTNVSFNTAGGHTVEAVYGGDTSYAGSTSNTVALQSNAVATATTLTATPASPAAYGQTVTLTAVEAPATSQGASAGGTITFYDKGVAVGSAIAIANGTAAITLPVQAVGTHTYTAVYSGSTGFQNSAAAAVNYTVAQDTVTMSAPTYTGAYGTGGSETVFVMPAYSMAGQTVPTGTISYQFPGFTAQTATVVNWAATITVPAKLAMGSGTLTLTYSGDANYAAATGAEAYSVTAPPLTVTVGNATRTYGAANPAFSSTITGALGGDTFTVSYSTTAVAASSVGTYAITATVTGANLANYTLTVVPGQLTVTQAGVSITANNATRQYGAANPTFTGSVTGAMNGDVLTLTFSTTATATSDVGGYPIVPAASGAAVSNYTVSATNGTLSITPLTGITLTANSATRIYGAVNPALTGTVTGAPANYALTVSGTTAATQSSPVGSYTIVPTLSGVNPADYVATVVDGSLTITQATTTTVLTSSAPTSTYGQAVTLTATVTPAADGVPAGSVTFYADGIAIGTTGVANGAATLTVSTLPLGTHTISATYGGDGNFTGSASGNSAQYVIKASLAVTVGSTTRVYGAANPALGGTVTGAVNGDTFTTTYSTTATAASAVGNYAITATVTGANLASYNVTVLPGTLTVTPAALSISASSATRVYWSANPTFTGSILGALNGDTLTLSFSTTATLGSDVGNYPIVPTASGAAVTNYTVTATNGILTITPLTGIILTANNATRQYGAANPTFTASMTPVITGLTVAGTTTATQTSPVGSYKITPVLSGAAAIDYVATVLNGTLTVTQASTTTAVSSSTVGGVYGQSLNLTATATPGTSGVPTGSIAFYDGTAPLGTASLVNGSAILTTAALTVGAHNITAVYSGDTNFTASASGTFTQNVNKALLTVTETPATRVYGAANPSFASTTTGAVAGDSFTMSYTTSATAASAVGTYVIYATVTGANLANYTLTVVPGSLTVTPAVLTLTANNATRVFDTANPTFTGGYSGALNGDSFTMSFSTTASLLSDVGTYAIVPSAAGAALANYTVSATNGTLTITPMTGATITANNATRTYGTANPVFTGSISGAPANSTLTVTGTTTATQYSPVGSYAITPAISGISSADYAAAVVVGTLTITQATTTTTLTSSAPNSSYGQAVTLTAAVTPGTSGAPTGGVTFYVDGNILGTAAVSNGAATLTSTALLVGTHAITAVYGGDANFTGSSSNSSAQNVGKATLTVTAASATRVYGAANPTLTGTITGAANGDIITASYATTATAASTVGSYAITATAAGANLASYNVVYAQGTLTVTPATLNIAANSATRAYGTVNPVFSGTISGAVNGDALTLSFTTAAATLSDVGTYAIVPAFTGAAAANYTATATNGTLTITPITLTLTANNATRLYGAANPAFGGSMTPAAGLTVTGTTTATQSSAVGSYIITPALSGATAIDYVATAVNGTLTITQAPTTMLLASSAANSNYGQAVTYTATVTPGTSGVPTGTVTFYADGGIAGTATLTNGAATLTTTLPVGTHSVSAIYGGDGNFTGSNSNSVTGYVSKAALTATVGSATRTYGTANPTFTSTITGASASDTFTVSYTTTATAASAAGAYVINATVTGTNLASYNLTVVPGTLTVTPAALTVTANSATRVYDAANPVFTGNYTGAVNGDSFTLSYSTTAQPLSDVGSYPIVPAVSGAALANYTLSIVNGTLTVSPMTGITITANNATRMYGVANTGLLTGSISGAPAGTTLTVTGTTTATQYSAVGSYPITPVISGINAADYVPAVVEGTLTITQAPTTAQLVSTVPSSLFGQTATLVAVVKPGTSGTATGSVTFNDSLGFTSTVAVVNGTATLPTTALSVGTHTISATYSGDNNFTTSTSNNITQIVNMATLTVMVNAATRVYGAANPGFTSTISGAAAGDTFTVSYNTAAGAGSNVGTYPVTATVTGANIANYNVAVTPGTLTVTPAALTVLAGNATRMFDMADPVFTGSYSGAVNGDTFTMSYTTAATLLSDAGTYAIVPAVNGSALVNYTVSAVNGTLSITPLTGITLTANNATRVYGTANPALTGTVSGAPANLTLTVTGTTLATTLSDVGTYTITPGLNGVNAADYVATGSNGVLTVTQAGSAVALATSNATALLGTYVTLTATVASATSGTASGQVSFYAGGILLGTSTETGGIASLRTNAIPLGISTLTASCGGNYDLTASVSAGVTETVLSNGLTVTVASVTRAYGTANPVFTSTITGGQPGDTFTVTYSTLAVTGSAPGTYAINATVSGANLANYNLTVVPGTLTVTGAVLTVTANNANIALGAALPVFTGTITGAVNGDVFTESFSTTATAGSPTGVYSITPGVTGTNLAAYQVVVVPGVLTIGKLNATILLSSNVATAAYGTTLTLTAVLTGVTGGTTPTGNVTFYDGTTPLGTVTPVAGVATLTVSTLAPGAHTLTAQLAGDVSYGTATSNSVAETVTGTGNGSADYTVAASPTAMTLKQGSSGSTTVTLTPQNGYKGQVNLGCTTLAQDVTCTFAATMVTLDGVNPVSVGLTVGTGTLVGANREPEMPGSGRSTRLAGLAMLPAMLLAGVFCSRRRRLTAGMRLTAMLLLAAGMLCISGCAHVTVGGGTTSTASGVTPVGTSTITVTMAPTAVTTGVYHTLPLTLTVTL